MLGFSFFVINVDILTLGQYLRLADMSTNNDYIFSSKRSAAARASEDFMPNEPTFQTLHVAAVSFNSLLLGEIVVPDWDMFYSTHYTAEFHAAAGALGGCPVYVRIHTWFKVAFSHG